MNWKNFLKTDPKLFCRTLYKEYSEEDEFILRSTAKQTEFRVQY